MTTVLIVGAAAAIVAVCWAAVRVGRRDRDPYGSLGPVPSHQAAQQDRSGDQDSRSR